VLEKSKFKAIAEEMDQTVADLVGYWAQARDSQHCLLSPFREL